jgi:CRP-like cAMP-binding protein
MRCGGGMIETHLLKLRKRDSISRNEEAVIRAAVTETRKIAADRVFIRSGQDLDVSTLLLTGWMARTKDLRGGQRQIVELHVAGDFADLHSFTLKRLEHDILTLTPCTVAVVPHDKLREITERYPHLTRVYWFLTNLDAAIHRERMVSLGQRSALSRMAHLFCELFARLQIVGLTSGEGYDFPLTQAELGEYLGLTSVHVNRTLQELRRRNLIHLENRRLTILDAPALRTVAEFDPAYLYLERAAE